MNSDSTESYSSEHIGWIQKKKIKEKDVNEVKKKTRYSDGSQK